MRVALALTFADRSVKTSPTTFPGQYNQGGNVENPLFPNCGSPNGIPAAGTAPRTQLPCVS